MEKSVTVIAGKYDDVKGLAKELKSKFDADVMHIDNHMNSIELDVDSSKVGKLQSFIDDKGYSLKIREVAVMEASNIMQRLVEGKKNEKATEVKTMHNGKEYASELRALTIDFVDDTVVAFIEKVDDMYGEGFDTIDLNKVRSSVLGAIEPVLKAMRDAKGND